MEFRNEYYFLSNFYPTVIEYEGMKFPCVEAAFQAAKSLDMNVRKQFCTMNGAQAKKAGRNVKLRPDWDKIKVDIMEELLRCKFSEGELEFKLALVRGPIVEDNYWGDTFWGMYQGRGRNILGKLLMKIRDELNDLVGEDENIGGWW